MVLWQVLDVIDADVSVSVFFESYEFVIGKPQDEIFHPYLEREVVLMCPHRAIVDGEGGCLKKGELTIEIYLWREDFQ